MTTRLTLRLSTPEGLFFVESPISNASEFERVLDSLRERLRATMALEAVGKPKPRGHVGVNTDGLLHDVSNPADLERLCLSVLGREEMVRYGARWRQRMCKSPTKLRRVISEMSQMQREGRAVRNPGSYAEDLWKRFA